MCGRYHLTDDPGNERVQKLYEAVRSGYADDPRVGRVKRGMIYPSDPVPVIGGDRPSVYLAWWGFPGFKGSDLIINARAETVAEKPTFKEAFRLGRCLVPASGFYEWDRTDAADKRPYLFRPGEAPLFYMAGIIRPGDPKRVPARFADEVRAAEAAGLPAWPFMAIITTASNPTISDIHHRMPLILDSEAAQRWLSDPDQALELAVSPCPAELTRTRV